MSTIISLLFSRYTFLIAAIVVIVALVGAGKLIWNRYTIGVLLALALGIGAWTGVEKWAANIRASERALVVDEYNTRIDAQKAEAKEVLTKALADNAAAALEFAKFKTLLEKDREISQAKNTADLRARRAGPRLQFATQTAGCRPSGAATKDGAPEPTSDAGTTVVQLPEPINGNLLDLAADAQSLNIDYRILYTLVNNPKLVCELRTVP